MLGLDVMVFIYGLEGAGVSETDMCTCSAWLAC